MWMWLLANLALATPEVVQLSAGLGHTCALHADGTVSCWGGMDADALKAGAEPMTTVPTPKRGLDAVRQISAGGGNLTCAVRGAGEVWCWLVDGEPARVEGLKATQVSVGNGHVCAVDPSRRVWCWGYNARGQVGDGTTDNRPTPVRVEGLDEVQQVATGLYHTCALRRSGRVSCWGYNFRGQLGDGTTSQSVPTPVEVVHLQDARSITAGSFHTCASIRQGGAVCWGSNGSGQLGDGSRTHSPAIVAVQGLTGVVQLDVGADHTCAVRRDGALACWGNNEDGQLGTGHVDTRLSPAVVRDLTEVTQVAVGYHHTCALRSDGGIHCWGQNLVGQLGDGTRKRRSLPAPVQQP